MNKEKPGCFGILDKVFPIGEDGHRKSPDNCINDCDFNKECIVKAIESDGKGAKHNEMIDAAYDAGNIGFLSRWSRKKTVYNANSDKKTKKRFAIFKRSRK